MKPFGLNAERSPASQFVTVFKTVVARVKRKPARSCEQHVSAAHRAILEDRMKREIVRVEEAAVETLRRQGGGELTVRTARKIQSRQVVGRN